MTSQRRSAGSSTHVKARTPNQAKRPKAVAEGRPVGSRRANGVAGRPLSLSRAGEKVRHAVRRKPPLPERLAARVKKETKRLEPPPHMSLGGLLSGTLRQMRDAVLPNSPRDIELRQQSGEPVVAFVGAVDLILLLILVVLLVAGTVMVYSASLAFANDNTGSFSTYLFRQTQWLLVGFLGMYLTIRLDYRYWRRLAGPGIVVGFVLMALMHTRLGIDIFGARRWLRLGPLQIEPAEVVKVALILYAAHWFAGQRDDLRRSLRGLLPFGVVVGALLGLVFIQPDLGTTTVIAVTMLMIYVTAGARLWHLGALAAGLGVAGKLYINQISHSTGAGHYQWTRFLAFVNPWADPRGDGFHYIQMLGALGAGGTTGVGLGNSAFKYTMPNAFSDTIFAIIGEEWGLIGTLGLLLLFLAFAWRGVRASILAPDAFGRLLAIGLTGSVVFQALLNMAVIANVVPFTGVPLPFISYGGSSLSISMVAAGILLNISKQAIELQGQEERNTATTYFWWRHRRAHLSLTGRRGASMVGPTPPIRRR